MTQPTSTAMAPAAKRELTGTELKQATLKDLLTRAAPSLAAVAPKHLTPERLVKIALSATSRSPSLLACSPTSILRAVMQGAEMGLEVGGLMGDAYLVPFQNKHTKTTEAICIPGYRGLIRLARNSGQIRSIEAHVVYEHDVFDLEFGNAQPIKHRPNLTATERGKVVCAWAKATFKDGGEQIEVMTLAELNAIRKRSQAADDGPWVTDEQEMQRKTVVRRLCKYLPLSPELSKALASEEASERGENLQTIDVTLLEPDIVVTETNSGAEPKSNVANLKGKVAEKNKAPADESPADPNADGR